MFAGSYSRYDLSGYTSVQLSFISSLIGLSIKWGYYPWDLVGWTRSRLLISCLSRGKDLPRPPLPFSMTSNEKLKLKIIGLALKYGFSRDPGASYEIPENIFNILFTHDGKGLQIAKIIDIQREYLQKTLNTNVFVTDEYIERYIKLRCSLKDASYHITSDVSRAIGLYVWDRSETRGLSSDSVIDNFLRTALGKKLCSNLNWERDPKTLREWYVRTKACINTMSVLQI